MATCIIEGCGEPLKPGSRLTKCVTCRAYVTRWDKRTSAEVLDWRHKLTVRHARLVSLVPVRVTEIRKRKLPVEVRAKARHRKAA